MSRKKKIAFKLNPEWMFKEPLDFEYNKYTLLDYLQKCEKNLDKYEIYPDFVELSLHLANVQSLGKENILLLSTQIFKLTKDKNFNSTKNMGQIIRASFNYVLKNYENHEMLSVN